MNPNRLAAALLFALTSAAANAANCDTEIEANDAMQYNKAAIVVPAGCRQFTVTLKHVGKLPKTAMGHNWVLTKGADFQPVATAGASAGPDKDYVTPGDARVIAHTRLVGGGESAAVTLDVAKLAAGESYAYFCSFPGHWALMKGTLTLAK